MRKGVKIGAAVLVLGIGLSGALVFPRQEPLPNATPSPATDEAPLVFRDERVAIQHDAFRPTVSPSAQSGPAPRSPEAPVTSTVGAAPARRDPPPALAPTYEHERLPMTWHDDEPYAGLPPQPQASPAARRPAQRIHRVTDGDTLARLAQRYLGDIRRAGEIFAANRDVLASPDVLEIGTQLKIPPRQARPSNRGAQRPPAVPLE